MKQKARFGTVLTLSHLNHITETFNISEHAGGQTFIKEITRKKRTKRREEEEEEQQQQQQLKRPFSHSRHFCV